MMDELDGKISITRPQGNGPDYIEITLTDKDSGVQFVRARIALANFAEAVTGLGHTPCKLRVGGLQYVGTRSENKTEQVFVTDHAHKDRESTVREALKPHEVDGWKGRVNDCWNGHRMGKAENGGRYYSVVFDRNVPKEET